MKNKILIFLLIFCVGGHAQQVKPLKLVAEMFDSIHNVKTLRQSVKAIERVNGGFNSSASEIKIQTSPRKIYFINKEKKIEILYNATQNSNKCYVKPNVFPYITLSLDPYGKLIRKNQHYTIFELGYEFIGRVIALALSKEKDMGQKALTCYGKKEIGEYTAYMMVYENKNFGYVEYTVQPKESISIIAAKLAVSDYMLRAKNNLYNDYGHLKVGSKILVPNLFAKRVVFYIDEKTMLPINVSVFDDLGLFESYEFHNIIHNKPIDPNEFTKEFKGYGF